MQSQVGIVLVPRNKFTVILIIFCLFGCNLQDPNIQERDIILQNCFDLKSYNVSNIDGSVGTIYAFSDGFGKIEINLHSPICGGVSFPFSGKDKFLKLIPEDDKKEILNNVIDDSDKHKKRSKSYSFLANLEIDNNTIKVVDVHKITDIAYYIDGTDEEIYKYVIVKERSKKRALVVIEEELSDD